MSPAKDRCFLRGDQSSLPAWWVIFSQILSEISPWWRYPTSQVVGYYWLILELDWWRPGQSPLSYPDLVGKWICADQYGFVADGDEIVPLNEGIRKINWNGSKNISFDDCDYLLLFLDSPMGTGKTHAVREYLRANPQMSVLSVTFSQALARRYLANELDLACYLDDSVAIHSIHSTEGPVEWTVDAKGKI
ncbi:hypothetical protein V1509DRAFT_650654, partial [Lipomyces kononenkoae]